MTGGIQNAQNPKKVVILKIRSSKPGESRIHPSGRSKARTLVVWGRDFCPSIWHRVPHGRSVPL